MTEEKKKGGAGKFFLGALLGAAAGAIAGRFVKSKAMDGGEELSDDDENTCKCKEGCDGCCKCCKEDDKKTENSKTTKKDTAKDKTSGKK